MNTEVRKPTRRTRRAIRRQRAAEGHPVDLTWIEWFRLWSRAAAMVLTALVMVPMHYLFRLFRLPSPWPKWFLGWVAWIVGARIKRIGVPLKRDVFYISNHLSWIDILALGGTSGTAFVAKAELA